MTKKDNKIFDGKFDDYSFKPEKNNRTERYSNEPCSIFEYDPAEVKVESLSLHESQQAKMKKNVRGNARVVEGFGKIDYYKKLEQSKPPLVSNSNRIVNGDPSAIKCSGTGINSNKTGVMTSADIRYSNAPRTSESNTALETMMHGSPMVWKVSGSGVCPTAAAQNRSVNSCMQGLQENCDNMRAPQGFQNFERTSEQQHNLTTTAIPFEPWNADKMGVQKFDPEMPYRPSSALLDNAIKNLPPVTPAVQYKSFNRAARPFGC